MGQQHAAVLPVRLKLHDSGLAVDVLRTIGYSARCACGWEGKIRRNHAAARADGRDHLADCQGGA
jgi:hypothetical protein